MHQIFYLLYCMPVSNTAVKPRHCIFYNNKKEMLTLYFSKIAGSLFNSARYYQAI